MKKKEKQKGEKNKIFESSVYLKIANGHELLTIVGVCDDLFHHTRIFHTYFFLFIFSSSSIIKFVSKFSILDHLRPFDWREVAEK